MDILTTGTVTMITIASRSIHNPAILTQHRSAVLVMTATSLDSRPGRLKRAVAVLISSRLRDDHEAKIRVEGNPSSTPRSISPCTRLSVGVSGVVACGAETRPGAVAMTAPTHAALVEMLNSQEFYELMQTYRHTPSEKQQHVLAAFVAVQTWILAALAAAPVPPATQDTKNCLECEGSGVIRERLDLAGSYTKRHCTDCGGTGKLGIVATDTAQRTIGLGYLCAVPSDRPLERADPIVDAARLVVDTFTRDESQGFRSRDRQFAIEVLTKAFEVAALPVAVPPATEGETIVPWVKNHNSLPVPAPVPALFNGHVDADCEVYRGVGAFCTCETPEQKAERKREQAECEAERDAQPAVPALTEQALKTCHYCKHPKSYHGDDGYCAVQGCPCSRFVLAEPTNSEAL